MFLAIARGKVKDVLNLLWKRKSPAFEDGIAAVAGEPVFWPLSFSDKLSQNAY